MKETLDLLEELLSITEQFKDLMSHEDRDRWSAIAAKEADIRFQLQHDERSEA